MSLFEFFATQTDVAAAQANVNVTQQKLAAEKAALLNLQKQVDPNGTMKIQVDADKQALQTTYIEPTTEKLREAVAEFGQWSGFARTLNDLAKPSGDQTTALQTTLADLANQDTALEQSARMHRRRFLDNFPQVGTGLLPHTGDNVAMGAFFIGFAVFFAAVWILYVPQFTAKNIVGPVAFLPLYWIVGTAFLSFFGTRDQPISGDKV